MQTWSSINCLWHEISLLAMVQCCQDARGWCPQCLYFLSSLQLRYVCVCRPCACATADIGLKTDMFHDMFRDMFAYVSRYYSMFRKLETFHDMFHDMLHDMLVYVSGLRRVQGIKK
jgi:hypothetical protein